MTDLRAKHTFVIPTYNRTALLLQLLRHYVRQAIPLNIVVLDSSGQEAMSDNSRQIGHETSQGAAIRHLMFPHSIPMAEKIAEGLKAVETPYVSLCADDDIVFPEAVAQAIQVLDGDPSVATAHGLYVSFRPEPNHEIYLMSEYSGVSLDAPHAGARTYKLCQRYESLFYAVARTTELQRVFDGVRQVESLAFQEFFQSIALLIFGKAIRQPVFYAARRSGAAAQPEREKWQTYYWFADSPEDFVRHFTDFRERLAAFWMENQRDDPPMSQDEIRRLLDVAFVTYFSSGCPPHYFFTRFQHLFPDIPFTDPAKMDLLHYHNPWLYSRAKPPLRVRIWQYLTERLAPPARYRADLHNIPFAWTTDGLPSLDRSVAALGGASWKLRLPIAIEWVREQPDFQTRYRDLVRYLNIDLETVRSAKS